ncbi:MAG: LemA family protein [Candidatus Diapherotrites archaeon]|nr:LemA family protein [Candidatus Diapherotrites archaeon]
MLLLWIIAAIIVIVLLAFIFIYNSLIVLQRRVNNAWAQIDVQLKRRADLIPNLIETVKGYARFERKVLNEITKARTALLKAKSPAEAAKAESSIASALKTIFAVAESYPKLRASENFKALQEEFATTENRIAYARQFYNDSVMEYNTAISIFPNRIVASLFGFKPREYFELPEESRARKAVKADFSDLA